MASTTHVNGNRSTDMLQLEHRPIQLRDPVFILGLMNTIDSDDNNNDFVGLSTCV